VDNVLWGGSVAGPADRRESTQAIRAFNEHLRQDERIALSLIPIGDGLTLALNKR
jgi:caffeoyl-CoA O-methyltransferase